MSIDGAIRTVATAMSTAIAMTIRSEPVTRIAPAPAKSLMLFCLAENKPDA